MFYNIYGKVKIILLTVATITISSSITSCKVNNGSKDLNGNFKSDNGISIDKELSSRVDSCFNKYLVYGHSAIYLLDLTADKPVYWYNKDSLMHSASCMKLLSGVAGLHLLGTDYKYETRLYIRGDINGDTLNGDVTFQTGLDPQLLTTDLNLFTKRLRQKGIRKIDGNIYIDAALTEPVKAEEHWYPWDLTFNRFGLLYKGGDRVMRDFKASLNAQGIKYDPDKVNIAKTPEGSRCIYKFYRPIGNVIKKMWENSSNTQGTSLLYTIGKASNEEGNFAESGIDYMKKFVTDELNMPESSAEIHDGCGLCIHNKLTPELLVSVLRYGYYNKPIYEMMKRYLPISGKTGSMRREISNPKIRGKIHAKTGTLSHPYGISTLSGFCKGKNGHLLCFAIMSYDMSVLDARMIQNKMCVEFTK